MRHTALAVAAHPTSAVAWEQLGIEYWLQFLDAVEQRRKDEAHDSVWTGESDVLNELSWVRDHVTLLNLAEAAFSRAIQLQPDYAAAYRFLGEVLEARWQGGNPYAAIWESLRSPLFKELFDTKLLDQALAAYDKSLALQPLNGYAHYRRGMILNYKNSWNEAFAALKATVGIDAANTAAHSIMGYLLALRHNQENQKEVNWDGTIRACRDSVQRNPKSADSHFDLGLAQFHAGSFFEAETALRKADEIKQDPVTRQYLAWILTIRADYVFIKDDEAIQFCREAIRLQPTFAQAHLKLGVLLIKQKLYEEGIAALQEGLRQEPLVVARFDISEASAGLRRLGEIKEISWGMILWPSDGSIVKPEVAAKAQVVRKALLDRIKEHTIENRRTLIELEPRNADHYLALSEALFRGELFDEAVTAAQDAIRLQPKSAGAYAMLGQIYARTGRHEESFLAFLRAKALFTRHGLPALNVGRFVTAALSHRTHPATAAFALVLAGHSAQVAEPLFATEVKEGRRLAELERKLTPVLAGSARPANASEKIELAKMCSAKRLYRSALRLYREAFTESPADTQTPLNTVQYDAARAAAMAGTGQGDDALVLEHPDRADWRKQALAWLRADLAACTGRADIPKERRYIRPILRRWLRESDLAGIRESEEIAKLPADDQEAWKKLWADVAELLKKVEEKK